MKRFLYISVLKSFLLVAFTLVVVGEAFSFQSTFVPVNESKLWIEGSSNVNQFECQAEEYAGEANIPEAENSPASTTSASNEFLSIKIDIQVDSIECGKRKMNQDLQKALKAERFPEITFQYQEANIIREPQDTDEGFQLEVRGLLTVAGTTKQISFITEAYYTAQNRVRATGGTTINMTDFGVQPPTALMGLIRANEELTVNFDLIAEQKN